MFKTIRMPFFSAEEGGGDDIHQESGVTFTPEQQARMDRIIGQRITSVKASYANHEDMKEALEALKDFGYTGTVAEVKAVLKQQAQEKKKAAELEELEEEAAESGTSPELLAEIKALKKDLAEIKQEKEQLKQKDSDAKKAEEAWNDQVTEFKAAHEDVDMDKLAANEKFMKHLKNSNPSMSLLDVYDAYIDLVGSVEAATIDKVKANTDRSTFSGKAKAEPTTGTHGLNDQQQHLAKQNGMSNKEYSDLLKQIS